MFRKYSLYLIRWQLSTPILAVCIVLFAQYGATWSTVLANFIGGLIFFWVDRWIFRKTDILSGELWEIKQNTFCVDCGQELDKGCRLVKADNYDRLNDKNPEYRCPQCSQAKYKEVTGG